MVDIIVHRNLEIFANKLNIDLKRISEEAFILSTKAGYDPPNKFVLNACPEIILCYDGYDGVPNVILDFLKLFHENKDNRDEILKYDLTHELSHYASGTLDFMDMVNYDILKGIFINETSEQELRNRTKNLLENTVIDPTLCMSDPILCKSFFKSNHLNLYQNLDIIKKLHIQRKKIGKFIWNLGSFYLSMSVIHSAVVSRVLKENRVLQGVYRPLATTWDQAFHINLKGAIGNSEINRHLDNIYKNLVNRNLNLPNATKSVHLSAKALWDSIDELKINS